MMKGGANRLAQRIHRRVGEGNYGDAALLGKLHGSCQNWGFLFMTADAHTACSAMQN